MIIYSQLNGKIVNVPNHQALIDKSSTNGGLNGKIHMKNICKFMTDID
jgi:hypothetical protein